MKLLLGPSRARRACLFALLAALALSLEACGRRGELEPAPDPTAVQKPADPDASPQIHKSIPKIMPPKKPFVLDPLL